ncbi:hypothetical protein ACU8YE_25245, partial [Ralstonia sp. VS2407]
VKGDAEAIAKLTNRLKRATTYSKSLEALRTLSNPKNDSEQASHSKALQIGLKRLIEDRGDVPTSENERKASEDWIKNHITGKGNPTTEYRDSERLVLAQDSVDKNLFMNVKDGTYDLPALTELSKKYVSVSDKLPKGFDTDAELIEIAM